MTIQKAISYFNLNQDWDLDDLNEEIETRLFEIKNFFLSKIPVQKLVDSRIIKLEKITDFALLLDLNFQDSSVDAIELKGKKVLEIYAAYQQEKQKIRLELLNSSNPKEILAKATSLIKLEKLYASKWYFDKLDCSEIIVSKEPDPMIILQEIKKMEELALFAFEDYKKSQKSMSQILLNEMKRLSLLSEKY
jgi:hypothetical protein